MSTEQAMTERSNEGDGVEKTTEDLLDVLLRNDEWKSTNAFHVTRVPGEERKPSSSELKFDLLNAPTCPPELVGLPSVLFSLSKWSNQSINNVTLNPDSVKYWRVQIPLASFQEYDIWYYKQPYKGEDCVHQVWLVLTREEERQYMEGLSNVRELKKGEENPFLYFKDGKWCSCIKEGTIKYSVNFVVLKGFSLKSIEGKWDIVELNHALSRDDLASLVSERWSVYRKNSTVAVEGKDESELLKIEREGLEEGGKDLWEILKEEDKSTEEQLEGDDLWKKGGWRNRMVKAEYAYHVTSIRLEERKPTYTELRWHLANDYTYDRQLVGLSCVFFSTTLWKGELPTESPYPAHGKEKNKYWRVQIPLNRFEDYDFWYCKYPYSYEKKKKNNVYQERIFQVRIFQVRIFQVRIILTKGEDERRYVENIPDIVPLDISKPNPFLYYNKEKWYTNDYYTKNKDLKINKNINYWTNFVVLKDFPLEGHHRYDYVKRNELGPGKPLSSDQLATAVLKNMLASIQQKNSPNQSANTQDEGDVDELNKRMKETKLSEENENGK